MTYLSVNYFSPLEYKKVKKSFNIAGVKNYSVKDKKRHDHDTNSDEKAAKQAYTNEEKGDSSSGLDIWA